MTVAVQEAGMALHDLFAAYGRDQTGSYETEYRASAVSSLNETSLPDQWIEFRVTDLDLEANHLISSPYPDDANLLRLTDLDISSRLLAFALTLLEPVTTAYATTAYSAAFNWSTVAQALQLLCRRRALHCPDQTFYIVAFRSTRRKETNPALITKLDQESHREACQSGGLSKYWFGECDGQMRNLATCIWHNSDDAKAGVHGPWHRKARAAARDIYEHIDFQTHKLIIGEGAHIWRLPSCQR